MNADRPGSQQPGSQQPGSQQPGSQQPGSEQPGSQEHSSKAPADDAPSRRPVVIAFDVNETLSDMSPMADRFVDVGAPGHLAATWFAGLLRDGFALTAAGSIAPFAELGAGALRTSLHGVPLNRGLQEAVDHIMEGFSSLDVHPDVKDGIVALAELGIRLATLSNGSAAVARGLFDRAGIGDRFERLLSVEDAGVWKPAAAAYAYAVTECEVDPADMMLVAVHPWDIDGASRAGFATGWINRGGGAYPDYFHGADVEVGSLTRLAELLR